MFLLFRIITKVVLHNKNQVFLQKKDVILAINTVYICLTTYNENECLYSILITSRNYYNGSKYFQEGKLLLFNYTFLERKQVVGFKENELKFDSLNKKGFCLL